MPRKTRDLQGDTITLRKKEIKLDTKFVPQVSLKFYPENPRIYSVVWHEDGEVPSQEEIFSALAKTENVREVLIPSIRSNGGLIEPVLVRGNVVIEGNSRLAAYRVLAQSDAKTWEMIKVRVLPDSVTDSEVFSLLGQYHIVGKKDWQPFEQAGYLYRRFRNHSISEEILHEEVQLSKQKIRHLIKVYDFMVRRNDRNPARWSYYDELLKGRRFDSARDLYSNFDEIIADKIESEEIERAVDVRDRLPLIVKAGGKTLKKFVEGKASFEDAVEDARLRGAGNHTLSKLSSFRKWLMDEDVEEELLASTPEDRHAIQFEFNKLSARLAQLSKKVKA